MTPNYVTCNIATKSLGNPSTWWLRVSVSEGSHLYHKAPYGTKVF